MKCPFCKKDNDKVIDSRSSSGGFSIRRRRQCLECERRYTTYEKIEETPLRVMKKDGSRVPYDREKILAGLRKACEKRPVSTDALHTIVDEIEADIFDTFDKEVESSYIGEQVMERLRGLDKVAYVRFASVYREFQDISDFIKESAAAMVGGNKPTRGPDEQQ